MTDAKPLLDLKKKTEKQLRKLSETTSVNSSRAKALLLLSEGKSQAEAAERAGLSLGQVRFWLGRYRANGTACFPELTKDETKPDKANKKPAKTKQDKKSKSKDKSDKKSADKKKSKKQKNKAKKD